MARFISGRITVMSAIKFEDSALIEMARSVLQT